MMICEPEKGQTERREEGRRKEGERKWAFCGFCTNIFVDYWLGQESTKKEQKKMIFLFDL